MPTPVSNRLAWTTALPAALAALMLVAAFTPSSAVPDADAARRADQPAWLAALDAPHRMLFDAATPKGGDPLIHTLNYYESWKAAEGIGDDDIDAVITLYGATTFHGLSDAMWSKYDLGAVMGENDLEGEPYTRNPWRVDPTFDGAVISAMGIEALGDRGVTFLMCNNAFTYLAGKVAQARGLDPDAVYADMKSHILPEVTLVPAMVVAIDQAQQAGVSYHRQ